MEMRTRTTWRNIFETIEEPSLPDSWKSQEAQQKVRDRTSAMLSEFSHLSLGDFELAGEWRRRSNCLGKTRFFYNDFVSYDEMRVEYNRAWRISRAKALCAACPVRDECKSWAMRNGTLYQEPIVGGMTWSERKRWLRRFRTAMRVASRRVARGSWDVVAVDSPAEYASALSMISESSTALRATA